MNYAELKTRQRAERHAHSPNLAIRVHRSLSWLNRAEQADDLDGRYVFLWIAFNAAYATEIDDQQRLSEQETFKAFLKQEPSNSSWTYSLSFTIEIWPITSARLNDSD